MAAAQANGFAATPDTSSSRSRLRAAYHTSARSLQQAAGNTIYAAADLTIVGMTLKIVREEGGIRALYRGLVATACGVAPYVGLNFAAYEFLRGVITPPGKNSVTRKLTCGALAGKIPLVDQRRASVNVTGQGLFLRR
jgi:solute carrier family 25 (mitochondrial phosphate transporter), member 23/24/25/41